MMDPHFWVNDDREATYEYFRVFGYVRTCNDFQTYELFPSHEMRTANASLFLFGAWCIKFTRPLCQTQLGKRYSVGVAGYLFVWLVELPTESGAYDTSIQFVKLQFSFWAYTLPHCYTRPCTLMHCSCAPAHCKMVWCFTKAGSSIWPSVKLSYKRTCQTVASQPIGPILATHVQQSVVVI